MTALLPAALAAVSAVVLGVAGFSGGWIVTAAAGLLVLGLAVGWADLLQLPHRPGSAVLIGGIGVLALVAGTLAVSPQFGLDRPLSVFTVVIAAAVLSSFAHEMFRRDGRPDIVESVTGTLSGQVIAVLAAGWVLLAQTPDGSTSIVIAGAAVALARIVSVLPLPLPPTVLIWGGLAAGAGAGLAVSLVLPGVSPTTAIVVGLAVGGVGLAVDHLFGPVLTETFELALLARATAPIAAAGTVAYALIRIGIG